MFLTIAFLQSCKLSDEIHTDKGCNENSMLDIHEELTQHLFETNTKDMKV